VSDGEWHATRQEADRPSRKTVQQGRGLADREGGSPSGCAVVTYPLFDTVHLIAKRYAGIEQKAEVSCRVHQAERSEGERTAERVPQQVGWCRLTIAGQVRRRRGQPELQHDPVKHGRVRDKSAD